MKASVISISGEESKSIRRRLQFRDLWQLVGNTPMVEIIYRYRGKERSVFAKCEHYNLTGSIKDRIALYILEQAYRSGELHEGDTIIEATSGNTGIAFSAIGKALGHEVKITMPDWMSRERMDIIRSLGAEVIAVSREKGGFLGSIAMPEKMKAQEPGIFLPHQFENQDNVMAHFITTGPEIITQLAQRGLHPCAFVAGVGTGGTVMGVGRYLKSRNKRTFIHAVEPAESPTLSTGRKVGSHRIQGISDEFIPSIVKLNELDPVISVPDGDSIIMAQQLARQLGLAVGISSGANFLAAVQLQILYDMNEPVVTVFSDSNKKYLSTALMQDEPVLEHYMAPGIELAGYRVLKRADLNK